MLMDGHAMVHRSFHAISRQGSLTVSSTGEDITGVYGFINVFLRAFRNGTQHIVALPSIRRYPPSGTSGLRITRRSGRKCLRS